MATNVADEVLVSPFTGDGGGLSEIFQTKSIRFGFLKGDGEKEFQLFHPTVKCRDFLSDVIQNAATKQLVGIYGFKLAFENNELDRDSFRLLLELPSVAMAKKFNNNFEFLLEKEKSFFDVAPSKLFSVKGTEKNLVIEGDRYWQSATQLASLYTYMCRVMLYLDGPEEDWTTAMDEEDVDGAYMKQMVNSGFEKKFPLLRHLPITKSPTPSGFGKTADLYLSHEYGGICSLIRGYAHSETHHPNFLQVELDKLCAAA